MLISELIEILQKIESRHGDKPVQLFNDGDNEVCDIESARFYKPTDYHGAVLDLDEPAVILLAWDWDDDDESPD
jgi:hypothetical protein